MYIRLCILFFLSLLILGCTEHGEYKNIVYFKNNSQEFNDSLTFKITGELSLPLDSVTTMSSSSLQVFYRRDSTRLFSILNPHNSEIAVYDYDSCKLINKIPVISDSVNGVGKTGSASAHFMINEDSIFLYNGRTLKAFLLNSHGQIIKKYTIIEKIDRNSNNSIPVPSTDKPIYVKDNKVYMICAWDRPRGFDQTKVLMVLFLDIVTGKIERCFPKSNVYNSGNWGRNYLFSNLYGTYNIHTNKFIYSFAADPFLFETSNIPGDSMVKHYVGSKFFREINPMTHDRKKKVSTEKSVIFDFTNPSFFQIIYDPFNDLYYRTTFLPIKKDEVNNPKKLSNRQETIIIMDKYFTKVGEYLMPRGRYMISNFFVTREGLHFLLKPELHKTQDSMVYEILKPIKLN